MNYSLRIPFRLGQKVFRVICTGGMGTHEYIIVAGWVVEGYKLESEEEGILKVMCYKKQGNAKRHEYINASMLFSSMEAAKAAIEEKED